MAREAGDLGAALRGLLREAGPRASRLRAVYEAAGYRPLWFPGGRLRPEAWALIARLERADSHGLDPAAYRPGRLKALLAAAGDPAAAARAELALSLAYAAYVHDLRTPTPAAQMTYTADELTRPKTDPGDVLAEAAAARSLQAQLQAAEHVNPIYDGLRAALLRRRASAPGAADEALILVNMDRARALPADLGRRYVLVNVPSARLWLVEDGVVRDSMAVGVGRLSDPTPTMAGLIRYALFNPHWNLPQSMVRDEIAPGVLREGAGYLAARRMEVLSDWSPGARTLDPAEVDWAAVAAGARPLRVRQQPGPGNMMGQVKLMLPNSLGIYLHDTPRKEVFARASRTVSAGCIRLEDAARLAGEILGAPGPPGSGADARVDLAEPMPVYITYFTLAPEGGRLVRRPDLYGRDRRQA